MTYGMKIEIRAKSRDDSEQKASFMHKIFKWTDTKNGKLLKLCRQAHMELKQIDYGHGDSRLTDANARIDFKVGVRG